MNENREMTQEREGKILESAIKTWGEEAQIVVAIEEMSELTKALSKYLRYYVAEQGDHGQTSGKKWPTWASCSIRWSLSSETPTEEEILKLLRLEQRIEAEADQP